MILILVLVCGELVLFVSISVSFNEKLRENAVLHTLGEHLSGQSPLLGFKNTSSQQ